ncbi:MAG: phosphate ABC transporter substrate-binding protein [Planctomycetes bacterium]|nr:phosphate ABC transporter substrate-binding protein [Planctomycetota bacterium]
MKIQTLVLIAGLCALAACERSGETQGKARTITVKGSDTMVDLGARWSQVYMHHNPAVTVQITGGGSGTGIKALIDGQTDICQASRPMTDKEKDFARARWKKEVVETPVALDGLAVFVNEQNPINELSLAQLEGVYRGKINDWKELGGSPGPIIRYGRNTSSGTHIYFKEHVLKNKEFATDVQALAGTAAVINGISQDIHGIGYGGIGYAKGVKAVRVRESADAPAYDPSIENVISGKYPISRKLYFYTLGEPQGDIRSFIDWVLSDEGQKVCEQVGYYPLPKRSA